MGFARRHPIWTITIAAVIATVAIGIAVIWGPAKSVVREAISTVEGDKKSKPEPPPPNQTMPGAPGPDNSIKSLPPH